jgi:hypothetical protein
VYMYVLINYFTKLFDMRLYGDNAVCFYSSVLLFTFMQDTQCYTLFYFQPLDRASFCDSTCFGCLLWPSSGGCNIIKMQAAYHISVNENICLAALYNILLMLYVY